MIQAYYKYKPVSFEALALLVGADCKDRVAMHYMADMLWLNLMRSPFEKYQTTLPKLSEIICRQRKTTMTAKKAESFVDKLIRTFSGKGVEE